MQDEMIQLRGTVETVTFENKENGYAVLSVCVEDGDLLTVVGPLSGSVPGEEITVAGRFVDHSSYGRQFEASACVYRMPESETAIQKYLSSGVLPNIGPATAKKIVRRFKNESLEILASSPEMLAEIPGMTLAKAKKASEVFLEMFSVREAMLALGRFGLSATECMSVYRHFGPNTMELIQQNPYLLCGYPSYFPFARVDDIADKLSFERDSSQRVDAGILYTLRHNLNNGHTCLPLSLLLKTASGFFMVENDRLMLQVERLEENGQVVVAQYDGSSYVYLPDLYRAELYAAGRIREMVHTGYEAENKQIEKEIAGLEKLENKKYAPLQKKAIEDAILRNILVVTGGPGTGKTTIVNAILTLFEQQADKVVLAAPTGRAAKRLSELTGRAAFTIHRLLEGGFTPGSDVPRFNRNAKNPLKCDVVVVDEMSMVDAVLFESLLDALRPGCRLVLVGDADQLPSVGPGNVLKGIIESGVVPVVSLTEIFRQSAASLIVSSAHNIVEGTVPKSGGKEDDFFFMKAYGSSCQKLVCDLVSRRLPESYGYTPVTDIQVLCPGRKGPLGTEALNARLQEMLNPPQLQKPEFRFGGMVFRLGDKVMQIKNNYDIPYTRLDGEAGSGAFNGDIGTVAAIDKQTSCITVLCEDREVLYSAETLRELELAYAITIHKSQGSEFEAIVIPLAEVPQKLRYRNLLYTGVTRAKNLCILTGEAEILAEMTHNAKRNGRFSCFARLLQDDTIL
ncbi:MAG: ATP-dependent RecD-like DNA helicase [Oscillospiraceae bacterium]